jgi:aquaporin Z
MGTSGMRGGLRQALAEHWPEYLIEAAGLGAFMLVACAFGTLLGHPASPVVQAVPSPHARRALMGVAMGGTAIALIYSPWGARSGAHFNPATTLAFWRLGKIASADALCYAVAQAAGGSLGVLAAAALLGPALAAPDVRYVATLPGEAGPLVAFLAEAAIAFGLMSAVLAASNAARVARFTGIFAGALVAAYITVEAPLSGMSMNPARSLASALPAGAWPELWIYFTAPPLGMLAAAERYVRRRGVVAVLCAKLHHHTAQRCIFRCRYALLTPARGARP